MNRQSETSRRNQSSNGVAGYTKAIAGLLLLLLLPGCNLPVLITGSPLLRSAPPAEFPAVAAAYEGDLFFAPLGREPGHAKTFITFARLDDAAVSMRALEVDKDGEILRDTSMPLIAHRLSEGWLYVQPHPDSAWTGDKEDSFPVGVIATIGPDGALLSPNLNRLTAEDRKAFAAAEDIDLDAASLAGDPATNERVRRALTKIAVQVADRHGIRVLAKPVDALPPAVANAANARGYPIADVAAYLSMLFARAPKLGELYVRYIRAEHDRGDGWASYTMAKLAFRGIGVPVSRELSMFFGATAVSRGVVHAHNVLGVAALLGIGMEANPEKARAEFQRAADVGDPVAMRNLGEMLIHGQGVKKDAVLGIAWLTKAAALEDSAAQLQLGIYYLNGDVLPKDEEKALALFSAAEDRNADATAFHASMRERGLGGSPADQKTASGLYLKAARQGQVWAQYRIGMRLMEGTGIAADPAAGRSWLEKAAAGGNEDARKALSAMAPKSVTSDSGGAGTGSAPAARPQSNRQELCSVLAAVLSHAENRYSDITGREIDRGVHETGICLAGASCTIEPQRERFNAKIHVTTWKYQAGTAAATVNREAQGIVERLGACQRLDFQKAGFSWQARPKKHIMLVVEPLPYPSDAPSVKLYVYSMF